MPNRLPPQPDRGSDSPDDGQPTVSFGQILHRPTESGVPPRSKDADELSDDVFEQATALHLGRGAESARRDHLERPIPGVNNSEPEGSSRAMGQVPSGNTLRRLGQYDIISELGRGGMGVVYKGWQSGLQRFVALKVLPDHLAAHPDLVRRFRIEARAAAKFHHSNITATYEIGEEQGTHFIAMEFVEGQTLSQLVRQGGPLTFAKAAAITAQAADALDFAHARGVIHRDIKPSNLMMTEGGVLKVMDFGLARIEGDDRMTMTGMTLGTPAYMAPEQAGAESLGPFDHRADIYALGVVLYELVTGQLPFDGKSKLDLLRKIVDGSPPPPHVHRPDIPGSLEAIVLRAMSRPVAERYNTAGEMRDALRAFLNSPEVDGPVANMLAPPPGPRTGSQVVVDQPLEEEAPARGSSPKALGAFIVVTLAALGLLVWVFSGTGRVASDPVQTPAITMATPEPSAATPTSRAASAATSGTTDAQPEAISLRSALGNWQTFSAFLDQHADTIDPRGELRSRAAAVTANGMPHDGEALLVEGRSKVMQAQIPGLFRAWLAIVPEPSGDAWREASLGRAHALGAERPENEARVVRWALLMLEAELASTQTRFVQLLEELLVETSALRLSGRDVALAVLPLGILAGSEFRGNQPVQHVLPQAMAAKLVDYAVMVRQSRPSERDDQALRVAVRAALERMYQADATALLPILAPPGAESPTPRQAPRGRMTNVPGATVVATQVVDWTSALTQQAPGGVIYSLTERGQAGLPGFRRLETIIKVGDGNRSDREVVVWTDGVTDLIFIDRNLDGKSEDEWPLAGRRAFDPTFVVTGRFSTSAIYPLILQIDSARRHLHVSTTHCRRGSISADGQELAFDLHDLAGRALFNDLEWLRPGQRPAPPTAALRLAGDGPAFLVGTSAKVGLRWLTLSDMAPLGTETYWVASPVQDVRITIGLSELPQPEGDSGNEATRPAAPPWIRAWHMALQHQVEYRTDANSMIRMAVPDGVTDLWIASPQHGPVRLHGRIPELVRAISGAIVLPPSLKEGAEFLNAVSLADPQSPFIMAGYFAGAVPDAAAPVPEFAFRLGSDGLRMALLVPDSSLDGGRLRTGAYVSPYIPEFHLVPLDQPMTYVALGGRLERRATVMIRAGDGGWQLWWRLEGDAGGE